MAEVVYTKNAPDAIGPYSQAMKVGNLVFTSGQIAINPATGNVEATGSSCAVGSSRSRISGSVAMTEHRATSCF